MRGPHFLPFQAVGREPVGLALGQKIGAGVLAGVIDVAIGTCHVEGTAALFVELLAFLEERNGGAIHRHIHRHATRLMADEHRHRQQLARFVFPRFRLHVLGAAPIDLGFDVFDLFRIFIIFRICGGNAFHGDFCFAVAGLARFSGFAVDGLIKSGAVIDPDHARVLKIVVLNGLGLRRQVGVAATDFAVGIHTVFALGIGLG